MVITIRRLKPNFVHAKGKIAVFGNVLEFFADICDNVDEIQTGGMK